MKKLSALIIVSLLCAVISGCIFDNSENEKKTPSSYKVSGKILDADGNGIPDVQVILTGEVFTLTDSTGAFIFDKVEKGSYSLTVSLAGYEFEPDKHDFTVSSENITGLDFTGTVSNIPAGEYNLSGKITDKSNNGISDVIVSLYDGKTFKTTLTGLFIFTKIPNGTYTLTLSKQGYTFEPEQRQVVVAGANVSGLNFTGIFAGSGGLLAENYFPLKIDSVLNYIKNIVFSDNSPDSTVEYYDAVTSATTHSGVTYLQVISRDKSTEETINTIESRVADNVVWSYEWQSAVKTMLPDMKKLPGKVHASGLPEIPLYDFNKTKGESWEVYNRVEYETNTVSILNASFEGVENLTMTAGNFNNCAKFKFVLEISNDEGSSTTTYYDWLAPGIGRVKTEAAMTKDGQPYSSWTDIITVYNIP